MSVAMKVSSIHLLYSIIKRTLLAFSSSSHFIFIMKHRFHAHVSEGVQKAWKRQREKCLLHIKFPLYYLYSECLSRLASSFIFFALTSVLSLHIDETWFEYISKDLFPYMLATLCIHTSYHDRVIITKQQHQPHQHSISLTYIYTH